jgi:Zn-finger nucleic acid-binding protein
MKCPICKTVELKISERQGIEVDYCPECRGVWLDRGELDKIIQRTEGSGRRSTSQDDYDGPRSHDDHYVKRRKRKGLLGEIFDF